LSQQRGQSGPEAWYADTHAQIARALTEAISQIIPVPLSLTPTDSNFEPYTAFLGGLDSQGCYSILHDPDCPEARVCIELSAAAARILVDRMLDPRRPPRIETPLTHLERSLLRRLLETMREVIARTLSLSLEPIERPSGDSRLPNARENVTVLDFRLRAVEDEASVRLGLPGQLPGPEVLSKETDDSNRLEIITAPFELPSEEVVALEVGDMVVSDAGDDEELIVHLDGKPRYTGRLVMDGGRRMVEIIGPIEEPGGE
jgi:flagellar motor switch protein FliM